MYHHFHLFGSETKKPLCFDHLEAFVHHRRTVDGDFCSHFPIRMLQSLCRCDRLELFEGEFAERSARSGEQHFVDGIAIFAHQALKYRTVLAVYGKNCHALANGELGNQFASHDQCLFVGERNSLVGFYRSDGGTKSSKSHHSCDHRVHILETCHIAKGFCTRPHLDREVGQGSVYLFILTFVGYHHHFGLKLSRLLDEQIRVASSGEGVSLVFVAVFADDVQSLRANRTSGTKYCYSFHSSSVGIKH